jgi:hypothetical protein
MTEEILQGFAQHLLELAKAVRALMVQMHNHSDLAMVSLDRDIAALDEQMERMRACLTA